jgi:hypothetical protein
MNEMVKVGFLSVVVSLFRPFGWLFLMVCRVVVNGPLSLSLCILAPGR